MKLSWFVLVSLVVCSGCSATIVNGGDGGEGGSTSECGDPPPPSGGYCPPAWECVDGEWVDLGGACPQPACPSSEPSYGSPCDVVGQICEYYSDDDCGYGSTAECTEEGWQVYSLRCSPPVECPEVAPLAGTSCAGWDYAWDCYYSAPSECGDVGLWAYCDYELGWMVSVDTPCEACNYQDAAGCEADPACQWLVPGCGEPALPSEGCYPASDCAVTGCGELESCESVVIDPCWATECNACGTSANVCLAQVTGGG